MRRPRSEGQRWQIPFAAEHTALARHHKGARHGNCRVWRQRYPEMIIADDRNPSPKPKRTDEQRGLTQDRTETPPADAQSAAAIRETMRNTDADDDSQRDSSNVLNRRNDEISDS